MCMDRIMKHVRITLSFYTYSYKVNVIKITQGKSDASLPCNYSQLVKSSPHSSWQTGSHST